MTPRRQVVKTGHPGELPEIEQLLDCSQLAEFLGVTVRHVRRMIAERRIQYVKVGKFVRFDPADVRTYVLSSKVAPMTSPLHDLYRR
jgi:excisionase family DNA binding protein